ncbi:MAG: signal peptide peptidase SppA [Muribaculaceae bacterium]|nr:signal peptide peptidase SppA [Muribaculaceae bacterium]
MMKKFLLIVCGSFVGVFLALTVFVISSIILSIAMMSMGGKMSNVSTSVSDNSILNIELSGDINERDQAAEVSPMALMTGGGIEKGLALNVLVAAIENAKENKNVKGIYLKCKGAYAAPATREQLRAALKRFKQSGKWIYAYGYEGFSQGDYYLASVADSIFINPEGAIELHGLASATPYYKKLLDNIGVKMQVIRVGSFKSAVEPYMLENMSDANRLQQEVYMGSIWKTMIDSIAADREMTADQLNQIADSVVLTMPTDTLLKLHLVDKVLYKHDMEKTLKLLTKIDEDEDLKFVSPEDLAPNVENEASGDKIAVLYACGEIDGSGGLLSDGTGIDTESMSEEIRKLQKDDDVKGLVLRVNSPGGSAFGSEQMWKALDEFKKSGKPFAVSMSDYAASGGYYISSGADRIFAERTTITGSIGIFGMIPSYEGVIKNKLGVNVEVVKTNENADMGVMGKDLTPVQLAALQNMVNRGYDLFTKRCADGRHVTQDSIKHIAEGRVWDGVSALQRGLVDEIGSLDAAVKWVAKKAGLKEGKYKSQNYPAIEPNWRDIFSQYMTMHYEAKLKGEMGVFYEYHKKLMNILNRDHILCILETELLD